SWCHREDAVHLWNRFAMIQTIRQHAQGECLDSFDGLLPCLAVGKNARDIGNLSQPAAIVLLFDLDGQRHSGSSLMSGISGFYHLCPIDSTQRLPVDCSVSLFL